MTITGQSALDKDEIQRMVRDAEAHADEDKARREEAETRNAGDSLVYQTERMMKEGEYADKLTDDERTRLEEAIKHLKDSLKADDLEKIKTDTDALMMTSQAVSQRLYAEAAKENQQQPGGGGGYGYTGGHYDGATDGDGTSGSDDDVVDAEIVDEAK